MAWISCVFLVLGVIKYGSTSALRFEAFKPAGYSSSYKESVFKDECESSLLTCVPREECGLAPRTQRPLRDPLEGMQCPLNFASFGGYCLFVPDNEKVIGRSHFQVRDFCSVLNSRPFYIQGSREFLDLENSIRDGTLRDSWKRDVYYWTDAFWEDKTRDRWEWRTTGEEIDWEKILRGSKRECREESLGQIEAKRDCIGLVFSDQKDCLLLHRVDCLKQQNSLCKLGSHDNRCSENSNSVCCYSPSYDFYAQNLLGGPGSHLPHADFNEECWINMPDTVRETNLIQCSEALPLVQADLDPGSAAVRIDGSFFYFTREEKCRGERMAVISSQEVHDFIVGYINTNEITHRDFSFIIGLKYEFKYDLFKWPNRKLIDHYKLSFWADGQPNKRTDDPDTRLGNSPCVAYRRTDINSYSWHLIPTERCSGRRTMRVCELPIRTTNLAPTPEEKKCGQRLERGVLARSIYYDFDYNQAQYGEFPWHAAVIKSQNYHSGVVHLFSCSGALIHKQYVLTSAHCVAISNTDFSVSLGDWDISEEASHIFDTELIKVVDVILHPGYKTSDEDHDIALLRLEKSIDISSHPHIGLGCLPTPELFYQHYGPWECFTLGWPQQIHKKRRILQRLETDLVSKRICRAYVKKLTPHHYNPRKYTYESEDYGYDRKYGYHHLAYEQHKFFDARKPDLFCTETYGGDDCIDDSTAILICRKPKFSYSNPFSSHDHDPYSSHKYYAHERIINAYGEDRFDGGQWYVMGLKHSLSKCPKYGSYAYGSYRRRGRDSLQIFTPVSDYTSFIHSHTGAGRT